MTGEVIKSFLVGLGFEVDDSSLAKFNKSILSATLRVTALYASVKAATAGILYGISEISDGFEKMGYEYRLIAPSINKTLQIRQETIRAYRAAGVNIIKVIQDSIRLNLSITKTKIAFEAIYKSAASRFFTILAKQSDTLRQKIYANMPKIIALVERFVKFVFRMSEALTAFGSRVGSILGRIYDFFVELDRVTNGWSTKILAVVAAWELLNLEFLATPLGALIAGIVALIALYDDFQVWKEGGDAFFNWSSFVPVIDAVAGALKSVWAVLQAIADVIGNVVLGFYQLFKGDKEGAFDSMIAGTQAFIAVLTNLWDVVKGVGGSLGALGTWGAQLFSGFNAQNVVPGGAKPGVQPLGVGGAQSALTNQNVHQQTQINVTGSADANAVGKAVAGEQNRVNFDAARNFKRVAQ